jgi:hypothetical protein
MKAILVFIDGTICDTRQRHALGIGSPAFYAAEAVQADLPVAGSVACLQVLAQRYQIVYMGARPAFTQSATQAWLENNGYPDGPIFLDEEQSERLRIARELSHTYDFLAGIGDRWDDNQLHGEIGCLSIILSEYNGDWGNVALRIEKAHQRMKIQENTTFLRGKVEGLARVCPLLEAHYGESLWDVWMHAVMELAENSRDSMRQEALQEFEKHGLNPEDLRDAAWLDDYSRNAEWETNPAYGLQDFELVEASEKRYVHRVTRCLYAELWKAQGKAGIGYHIHCQTDRVWWDRPAWNPRVRFEQPQTIMKGAPFCLFIQTIPEEA